MMFNWLSNALRRRKRRQMWRERFNAGVGARLANGEVHRMTWIYQGLHRRDPIVIAGVEEEIGRVIASTKSAYGERARAVLRWHMDGEIRSEAVDILRDVLRERLE